MKQIVSISGYIEIGLGAGTLLGFILKIQQSTFGDYFLSIALSLLILLYFSQLLLPGGMQLSVFPKRFDPLAFASYLLAIVGLSALLMKLMLWAEVSIVMRYVLASFVAFILFLMFQYRLSMDAEWILHYRRVLRRTLIILATVFLFFLTPYQKMAKLYYPDHPQYVEALLKYLENPKNQHYQNALEEAKKGLK